MKEAILAAAETRVRTGGYRGFERWLARCCSAIRRSRNPEVFSRAIRPRLEPAE